LFTEILADTLGRGAAACRPLVPNDGLSETFVDPALARLRAQGAEIRFGALLRALRFSIDRVSELVFDTGSIGLAECDSLILAVPPLVAARLVPALVVPDAYSPIVNAHFRCAGPSGSPLFIGVIGGARMGLSQAGGAVGTVSAAMGFVDLPADELRQLLWSDAAMAYQLPRDPVPPARIVKERRATFLASPEQLRRRPGSQTSWKNLLLAGDYVDTGFPATIEGAIQSGARRERSSAATIQRPGGRAWRLLRSPNRLAESASPRACDSMNDGTMTRGSVTPIRERGAAGLDEAVTRACTSLLALQRADGHWVFELEADATIPSEFILLQHYLGRIEPELQVRIARYIRAAQGADGGWPLFHGSALDISASVKAYFALKAAGDSVDMPHMTRARTAIPGTRRCRPLQ
jgi:hypothetical protein